MAKASVTVALGADAGEFADAMDAAALSYKEFDAMLKAGKATFDATRTNAEKYEAEIAKLDHQLRQGAISQDTYNRAVAKAGDAFASSPFKAGTGQVNDFSGALNKAVPKLDGLMSSMAGLGPAGFVAAAAIAALSAVIAAEMAVINAIVSTTISEVTKAFERLDQLGKASTSIGVSTEALSSMRYAAGFAGVEAEDLDKSLAKMLKNVGKAAVEGGTADEVFKRLGLSSKALANLDADQQFLAIAAALEAIDNPAQRATEGNEIFGKSWSKLAPLIDGGTDALRESQREAELFGQRISDVDAAAIQLANDEIEKVKLSIEGAANVVASELAPSIAAVASLITTFIKDSGGVETIVGGYFQSLKDDVNGVLTAINTLAPGLIFLAKLEADIFGSVTGADDFLKAFEDAQATAEKTARMEAERQKKNRENKAAIDEETAATNELEKASQKVADMLSKIKFEADTAGLSEAEKKLQELSDAGATGQQLIEANAALAAQAAAKDAEKALKKAEDDKKRLDEMLAKAEKEGRQASMSDVDKKLDDLRAAGASQAQQDEARAALEKADSAKQAEKAQENARKQEEKAQENARKEQEKFASDAKKLAESLRTPQEKYADTVAEADKMRNAGLLDAAQYTKALAKAQADYNAELEKTNKPIGALEKGSAAAFSAIEAARRKAAQKMPPLPQPPQGLFPPGFPGQPQPQGLFPPPPKQEDPFTVGGGKGGGVGVPLLPKPAEDPFTTGGGKGGIDANDLKNLAPPAPVAAPTMPSDPFAKRAAEEAAKASKAVDDLRRQRGMEPRPDPIPVVLPPSDSVSLPPVVPEPVPIEPAAEPMWFKKLGDTQQPPEPASPPEPLPPPAMPRDSNAQRAADAAAEAAKAVDEMRRQRGMEPRPAPMPDIPRPPMANPDLQTKPDANGEIIPASAVQPQPEPMWFKKLGETPQQPQPPEEPMWFKKLGERPQLPEPRNPAGMDAAGTKVESAMQREDPTLKKLDENTKRAAAAAEAGNKLLAEVVKKKQARTASFN